MAAALLPLALACSLSACTGGPDGRPPVASAAEETTTPSGLRYVDLRKGDGPLPARGQTVSVHYVGTLANGKQFDSSRDRGKPFEFALGEGQVIAGWDEGISTLRVGGKRRLVIPPELGYGRDAFGPIPGNSTLFFEVELLGVR